MTKRNVDFRPVDHEQFFNGSEAYPAGLALWRHDEHGTPVRLIFGCPCGCGTCCGVTVKPFPNGWEFNGDKLKPTLQPLRLLRMRLNGLWRALVWLVEALSLFI